MPSTNADVIRRIELRLSIGEVAKGVELLRGFADSESLDAAACNWAIQALGQYGEEARIEALVRRLEELEPGSEANQLRLADFLREAGRFAESEAAYRRVLASIPRCGRAIYYLASMGALREQDMPETGMDELAGEDHALIQFALGRVAEDAGRYEEAMRHFDHANGVAKQHIPPDWKRFDRARIAAEDEGLRQLFTGAFLKRWRAVGLESDRSVFVIGMPRSGTTLLERILAGHPGVHAAGELSYWTQRGSELIGNMRTRPQASLPMAEGYERLLDTIAPGAAKVINKNPMNAKLAGALHMLMPNARFVWCGRHPVDHCFSMYKTFGGAPKDMAFSKRLLVDGYRLNEGLKEHWAKVIAPDRFMEITYEQLVTDNEATARQVVAFCGLEWSDRCLGERSGGSVRTPSAWQVRQPIYTSSLNSWVRYEPWLGEFRELL